MVAKMITVQAESVAHEVADSLKLGDHLRHDRQWLRGVVALSAVFIFSLIGKKKLRRWQIDGEITFVVSNPVAHGSRFARAVLEALIGFRTSSVCDLRLGKAFQSGGTSHFPSLTALSLHGWLDLGVIARAVQMRRSVRLVRSAYPSLSRFYLETLFIVQAIRYVLAKQYVERHPKDHLWLFDFDRHAYCRPLAWWARNLQHKTVTLVHGSPNANYLPLLAQDVLVWGEAQVDWFRERSPESAAHIIGRPELPISLPKAPSRALRVVHSLEKLSAAERDYILFACQDAERLGLKVSLRLHPSAGEDDLDPDWEIIRRSCLLEDNSSHFLDSLESGDVVLGVCSTAVIDALASGVPAWITADDERELPCDLDVLKEASEVLHRDFLSVRADAVGVGVSSGSLDLLRRRLIGATGEEAAGIVRDTLAKILQSENRSAKF